VKFRKSNVQSKAYFLPELKFEKQALTSFAGLVILQKFFAAMNLKHRLQRCFAHLNNGKIFDRATVFLQLVVHLILGYRELQDSRYYRDDPLVKRLLGLNHLPDVATVINGGANVSHLAGPKCTAHSLPSRDRPGCQF